MLLHTTPLLFQLVLLSRFIGWLSIFSDLFKNRTKQNRRLPLQFYAILKPLLYLKKNFLENKVFYLTDKELYAWMKCVKGQPHDHKHLMPTQIIPGSGKSRCVLLCIIGPECSRYSKSIASCVYWA